MVLKIETTALLYGTIGVIIFLFPYFMYAKEFLSENGAGEKGQYFQVIGKIIGFHLTFLFGATVSTSIADIMMAYRPDYSPSECMKMFYNTDGDWQNLISHLVNYSGQHVSGESSQLSRDTAFGFQIVMNYYGVTLAFFLLIIPILVLTIAVTTAFKKTNQEEQKISERLFMSAIAYVFITFLVWFHAMLSSTYVSMFTGVNFSFYKIMSSFWHTLLLGQ